MIESYYDALAPYYKLMYPNWEASVERQAAALDGVIRETIGEHVETILDAACGIGTQSIGLARLGYRVTASDISSKEIARAKNEALAANLPIEFQVSDMRQLWESHHREFDLVIACDNAVPHLLDDEEILRAFKQFYKSLKPDGGCIISVRDYTQFENKGKYKHAYPRLVHPIDSGQLVMFDVWDFDGDLYEITTYIIEDKGESEVCTKVIRGGRYYCVQTDTLEKLFIEAGFQKVTTLGDRFFQPLIVAKKAS